jgi:hypothetical protein
MRAGGQRDVKPIVDQDSGSGVSDRRNASLDEMQKIPRLHVPLANLHEFDTRLGRGGHAIDERVLTAGEPATVGDHADDGLHGVVHPSLFSLLSSGSYSAFGSGSERSGSESSR